MIVMKLAPKKHNHVTNVSFRNCQLIKRAGGSPSLLLLQHQAVKIQLQMYSSLDKPARLTIVPDYSKVPDHYLSNQI